MKTRIYSIFDVVSDSTVLIGTAPTDGAFIRQNMPYLEKINPNFLNDFKVSYIGDFIESTGKIVPCDPTEVAWDSYKHPEIKQ